MLQGRSAGGADAAQDPMLGQTLGGKYKVVRLLGEGGMGSVYEGEQQLGTAKRRVAVKTLHAHLSRDPKVKARFEREVGTIAELEHPNTIQVFDFGSTPDGILYIVMEFLQGKSIGDVLEKEGAMAPDRVDNVFAQVCGSLEEAHNRGIVHRDLKPDNVVLVERAGKKDFVKVLDFGIAKRAKEEDKNEQKLTQQGMVLGTPPYMSPEQFTGQPIDARSDIYSLAVVVYEMLTGRLPFKANTAWEWANQHMTQPPLPIESLAEGMRAPPAMRSAILRALSKAPEARFQTVGQFLEAFRGLSSAAAAGPAPNVPSPSGGGRQKTEVGTPLDVAAAFGGPPPGMGTPAQAQSAGPPVSPHGYTPAGSNVSFPTPAGIPQPPPRESRGGGRTPLLIAAGVIGLASIAAIGFAVRGGSHGGSKDVVFDNNNPPPAPDTSLTPASAATDTSTPPSLASGSNVPPLTGGGPGGGPLPHPQPHPVHSQAEPPTPPPGPQPSPQPTSPQPAPAKYDGPECQKARQLKALGHPKEAQSWALACIAKGGSP
jgi:serine/threonine-protein kinase